MPQGKGTYGTTRGRPPKKKPSIRKILQDGALGNLKNPKTGKSTYPQSKKSAKTVLRKKPVRKRPR